MVKRLPNADEETEALNAKMNYPEYDGNEDTVEQILAKRQKTGGRTAGTPNKEKKFALTKVAQTYSLRAFATVVEVMEDTREGGAVRLAAAKEILDRGFGRAKQTVEVGGVDGEDIQHRLVVEFVGTAPHIQPNIQPAASHNNASHNNSFVVNQGEHLPNVEQSGQAALQNRLGTSTAPVALTDLHPREQARQKATMLQNQPNAITDVVEGVVLPVFKKPWEA